MFGRLLLILAKLREDERGATLVEYALLVALIALVAIVGITATGTSISSLFSQIATSLTKVP
jgi:pilus assembly protein Flp/PilA